eukprot:1579675-Prymnesium_polylepis.1
MSICHDRSEAVAPSARLPSHGVWFARSAVRRSRVGGSALERDAAGAEHSRQSATVSGFVGEHPA